MSDLKDYSKIETFQSCIYRLGSLIEVMSYTTPMHEDTRRNIHDDLIEIRSFLLRYEKFQ
jgi:hypothetical protein